MVSSLAKEAVHVSIDLIRVPNIGWCLRFNPLVYAASTSLIIFTLFSLPISALLIALNRFISASATTNDSVDHFIKCLETKIVSVHYGTDRHIVTSCSDVIL